MPHTYVLLFYIVAAACLLTWIIPAGEFQYQSVDVNGTMRKIVVAISPIRAPSASSAFSAPSSAG